MINLKSNDNDNKLLFTIGSNDNELHF